MNWSTPPTKRSYPCRGDYIKQLRESRGWTQEAFATQAGYSQRLIRKAEGSANLNPETVADLAEALGTSEASIYPEDLVSDPVTAAKLLIRCYDQYEREMLPHCSHILDENIVFWCAGDENEMPIAGSYHGLAGFQEFLDRFFSVFTRPRPYPFEPTFTLAGNEVVARYSDVTALDGVAGPPVWIVNISKFERGRIIRIENYFDTMTGQRFVSDGQESGAE